jgi:hypothetical protein
MCSSDPEINELMVEGVTLMNSPTKYEQALKVGTWWGRGKALVDQHLPWPFNCSAAALHSHHMGDVCRSDLMPAFGGATLPLMGIPPLLAAA